MNIVNLQRDATFVDLEGTALTWGGATAISEAQVGVANTSAVVYDSYASARSSRDATITMVAANHRGIGVFLKPPIELSPYRVKCYARGDDAALSFSLAIGFSSNTIDGSADEFDHYETFNFDENMDELFMLEPETSAGILPLCFAIMARGVNTGAKAYAHISVQRLATSPPQFSQSVS